MVLVIQSLEKMGFLVSGLGLFFVNYDIWKCMWIFVAFDFYLKEDAIYFLFVSFLIIFFVNSLMLLFLHFKWFQWSKARKRKKI